MTHSGHKKKLQISHHTVLVATPFVAPVTTKGMATLNPIFCLFLSALLFSSTPHSKHKIFLRFFFAGTNGSDTDGGGEVMVGKVGCGTEEVFRSFSATLARLTGEAVGDGSGTDGGGVEEVTVGVGDDMIGGGVG